jgi:hypothetical protein
MSNHTEIVVLLDRSGSMTSIASAMKSGFDELVTAHKQNPTTRFTLVQFDSGNPYERVYTACPVGEVPALVLEPRGLTPLLDTFCKAIDETGRRLADTPEADRPAKVLFVVITDGEENASRLHTRQDVKVRVEHQTSKYNWQFLYLGANQDAIAEAASFGIQPDYAITYTASLGDTRHKMRSMATNTVMFANSSTGDFSSLRFSKEQREDKTNATADEPVTTGN